MVQEGVRILRTRDNTLSYAEPSLVAKLQPSATESVRTGPAAVVRSSEPPTPSTTPHAPPQSMLLKGRKARIAHGIDASLWEARDAAATEPITRPWAGRIARPSLPLQNVSDSHRFAALSFNPLAVSETLAKKGNCPSIQGRKAKLPMSRAQFRTASARIRCDIPAPQKFNPEQRATMLRYLKGDLRSCTKRSKQDYASIAREVDGLAGGRRACGRSVQHWFWSQKRKPRATSRVLSPIPSTVHGAGVRGDDDESDASHRMDEDKGKTNLSGAKCKKRHSEDGLENREEVGDGRVCLEERESWVGKRVSKIFPPHGRFSGTVTQYARKTDTYEIIYEDEDSEVLTYEDMVNIVISASASETPKTSGLNAGWMESFAKLQHFVVTHGHPHVRKEDKSLGTWVQYQRYLYRCKALGKERLDLLQGVGFCFDGRVASQARTDIERNRHGLKSQQTERVDVVEGVGSGKLVMDPKRAQRLRNQTRSSKLNAKISGKKRLSFDHQAVRVQAAHAGTPFAGMGKGWRKGMKGFGGLGIQKVLVGHSVNNDRERHQQLVRRPRKPGTGNYLGLGKAWRKGMVSQSVSSKWKRARERRGGAQMSWESQSEWQPMSRQELDEPARVLLMLRKQSSADKGKIGLVEFGRRDTDDDKMAAQALLGAHQKLRESGSAGNLTVPNSMTLHDASSQGTEAELEELEELEESSMTEDMTHKAQSRAVSDMQHASRVPMSFAAGNDAGGRLGGSRSSSQGNGEKGDGQKGSTSGAGKRPGQDKNTGRTVGGNRGAGGGDGEDRDDPSSGKEAGAGHEVGGESSDKGAWLKCFKLLKEYKVKYGHDAVRVTMNGKQHKYSLLGKWTSRQRSAFKLGTLLQRRKERLESIQFTWCLKEAERKRGLVEASGPVAKTAREDTGARQRAGIAGRRTGAAPARISHKISSFELRNLTPGAAMRMRKAARKSGWGPTNKVARQSARQRIVPSDSGSTAIAPAKYDNKGGVEGKTWRGWRSRSLPSSVVNRIQDTLQDLHRMGEESKVREGARLCFKWAPCEWYFGTVRTPTSSAGWWNVEWDDKTKNQLLLASSNKTVWFLLRNANDENSVAAVMEALDKEVNKARRLAKAASALEVVGNSDSDKKLAGKSVGAGTDNKQPAEVIHAKEKDSVVGAMRKRSLSARGTSDLGTDLSNRSKKGWITRKKRMIAETKRCSPRVVEMEKRENASGLGGSEAGGSGAGPIGREGGAQGVAAKGRAEGGRARPRSGGKLSTNTVAVIHSISSKAHYNGLQVLIDKSLGDDKFSVKVLNPDPIGAVKPHVILKNFNLRPISVAELTLPNKERYDDLMKDRRSRHYDGEKKVMAGGDVHGDNREGCSSNVQDSRTSTLQQTMPTVAAVKVGGTLPEPCERAEAAPAVPNAGAAPARSCSTEQKSVGSAMPPVSVGDLDGMDTSFGVEAAHDVWADRFVQFAAFVSMHGAAAAEADRLHGPWLQSQREVFESLKVNMALTEVFREKEALLHNVLQKGTGVVIQIRHGPGMIGSLVEKAFPGYGLFTGHVQAYFTKDSTDVLQGEGSCSVRQQGFYHIVYEDQDEEDIPQDELAALLVKTDAGAAEEISRDQRKVCPSAAVPVDDVNQVQGTVDSVEAEEGVVDATWLESIQRLRAFVNQHGHAHVGSGHALFQWAQGIRAAFRSGTLPAGVVALLRKAGFCFDTRLAAAVLAARERLQAERMRADHNAQTWNGRFEQLRQYWLQYGHAHPRVGQDGGSSEASIGGWVRDQRLFFKRDMLSLERISLLRGIDFCFDDKMADLLRSEVEASRGDKTKAHLELVAAHADSGATIALVGAADAGAGVVGACTAVKTSTHPESPAKSTAAVERVHALSAASASADAGSVVLDSCTVVETGLTQESLVEPATEGEGAGPGQMADHAQTRVIHAQEHTTANEVKRRTDAAAAETPQVGSDIARAEPAEATGGLDRDATTLLDDGSKCEAATPKITTGITAAADLQDVKGKSFDIPEWNSQHAEKTDMVCDEEARQQEQAAKQKEQIETKQGSKSGERGSKKAHEKPCDAVPTKRPGSADEMPLQSTGKMVSEERKKTADGNVSTVLSRDSAVSASVGKGRRGIKRSASDTPSQAVDASVSDEGSGDEEEKDSRFAKKFQMLQSFKAKYGHAHPRQHEERVGMLATNLRQRFRAGQLTEAQQQKLTSIGFCFDGIVAQRLRLEYEEAAPQEESCAATKTYVEGKSPEDKRLSRSSKRLSGNVDATSLAEKSPSAQGCSRRVSAFVAVTRSGSKPAGSAAAVNEEAEDNAEETSVVPWEESFAKLEAFKLGHGHVHAPNSDEDVGTWVMRQRFYFKRGSLTAERVARLKALGFEFDGKKAQQARQELLRAEEMGGKACTSRGELPSRRTARK